MTVKKTKPRVGTKPKLPTVNEKFMLDVVRLAKLGMNDVEIAQWFRCSKEDWASLLSKHPRIEIEEGYGRSLGKERYATLLEQKAEEGDVKAMSLWLKSPGAWQEVNRQDAPPSRVSRVETMQKVTLTLDDPKEAAKVYERMVRGK